MLFTSLEFFAFLSGALLVHAALPPERRWLAMLLASAVFYAAARPAHLLYLGGVTLIVLAAGALLARARRDAVRRAVLAGALIAVLGALAALKFSDFVAGEVEGWFGLAPGTLPRLGATAPPGFSFYAFTAASFVIDAWARRLPETPTGHVALHLAWFPKLLAGPIERGPHLLPQLAAPRADPQAVVLGLQLLGWGLLKKVVIADNLAPLVDRAFSIAAFASPLELLLASYFFAFQIYCDFSGYTDIALGVSLLFGLRLMENFRRPYLSRSVAEFWGERWHISLGRWFRDYLYIPLGGNRVALPRRMLSLMLVFVVSGLWHAGLGWGVGWTFLVWGALNGAWVCVGAATRPLWQRLGNALPHWHDSRVLVVLRVLLTFHLILVGWVFFRAKTVADGWLVLSKIGSHLAELPTLAANYPYTSDHIVGAVLIALLLVVEILDERRPIVQRLAAWPVALRWSAWYAGLFALLLLGQWQMREFIYMQF